MRAVRRDDVLPSVFLPFEFCSYFCRKYEGMIVIKSTPADKHFSSLVPDLVFSIDGKQAVVTIEVDEEQVFKETLTPFGGSVYVSNLTSMLAVYAERRLIINVQISIVEQTVGDDQTIDVMGQPVVIPGAVTDKDSKQLAFQVLYSAADVGLSASEFYSNHFLSILMGPKLTAMGRLEYLHYYGNETPLCTAYYADGSNKTFTPMVTGGNSRYTQLDVSADNFATDGKVLVSYIVTAGSRSQEYEIDMKRPDCAPILLFENSFGVQEMLYCTGKHKVTPEYKRMSARFGGLLRNYDIEETRTFQADTGVLTTPMANWADELFRSKEVFIVNIYNGIPTVGKEVVITDCKSENSNEDSYLPRFTFSYQYAQRIHNVVDLKREGRIFDNTFDNTFN